jgi:PIN domain nuclease of toxin-antitoxin system
VILLDTHVVVWWSNGDLQRLSAQARERIEQAAQANNDQHLLISTISCWEVAMLVQRGRLGLSLDCDHWRELVAAIPTVRLLALEPSVAIAATTLPEPFHPDPADRFLVAQARALGVPLITADAKIRDYPHVQTLW